MTLYFNVYTLYNFSSTLLSNFMKTNVKRWGNSVAVRIPQPFAKEVGMKDGTVIEIKLVQQKIILSKPKMTLDGLLKQVKPDNIHSETDTGSLHGKEIW